MMSKKLSTFVMWNQTAYGVKVYEYGCCEYCIVHAVKMASEGFIFIL